MQPHGLTDRDAAALRDGKICDICGSSGRLTVDHCHTSLDIRGILCHPCNMGLGHFKDDPEILQRAAKYLRKVNT